MYSKKEIEDNSIILPHVLLWREFKIEVVWESERYLDINSGELTISNDIKIRLPKEKLN